MPSTTLIGPTLHHRGPKLFTTSSTKDKRHNKVHFFDNALLNARWIVWILISNDICVDRSFHYMLRSDARWQWRNLADLEETGEYESASRP